jgi:hypothetical protein
MFAIPNGVSLVKDAGIVRARRCFAVDKATSFDGALGY